MRHRDSWKSEHIYKYDIHLFNFKDMWVKNTDTNVVSKLMYTDDHKYVTQFGYRLCYELNDRPRLIIHEINNAYEEYVMEQELLG